VISAWAGPLALAWVRVVPFQSKDWTWPVLVTVVRPGSPLMSVAWKVARGRFWSQLADTWAWV
jgi:hypothetical protein